MSFCCCKQTWLHLQASLVPVISCSSCRVCGCWVWPVCVCLSLSLSLSPSMHCKNTLDSIFVCLHAQADACSRTSGYSWHFTRGRTLFVLHHHGDRVAGNLRHESHKVRHVKSKVCYVCVVCYKAEESFYGPISCDHILPTFWCICTLYKKVVLCSAASVGSLTEYRLAVTSLVHYTECLTKVFAVASETVWLVCKRFDPRTVFGYKLPLKFSSFCNCRNPWVGTFANKSNPSIQYVQDLLVGDISKFFCCRQCCK